ncbi:uncharacterized protein LOC114181044 isoform X3 [Vigna unguiculata]|uniref:uncharacterized protein LOC114181044 isoform X3 n=1 Tax=Vigna unguiculata TaxID=3917 RepID=UPI001015FA35|nr:uncharacterized protein LOC114181044 isoform X3 [Vigna unguiculata]
MLIMVEALVGDIVILDISATTTDQDESNVQIVPSAESKARYLSKSHTPTARSILAQKMASTTALDSIQESLLGSAIATQSAPASRMKSTLCLGTKSQLDEQNKRNEERDKRLDAIMNFFSQNYQGF